METEIAKADAEEKAYARAVINDDARSVLADIKSAAFQRYNRPDQVKENISCAKPSSTTMRTQSKKEIDDNSETAELFLQDMMDVQRQQLTLNQHMFQAHQARDQHLEQLLSQQRQLALSMTLSKVEVPTFGGDPIHYSEFIRSSETLIENKTASSSARLSYLIQYTSGDVQELMRSCLTMNADDGYEKARSHLKQRYGENHRIATAYVNRIINGPVVKDEDDKALHKLSIQITSCKNTLQDIGYQHRLENPENLLKVLSRPPFSLRKAWRDVAEDISSNQLRDITFDDHAKFVERKARTLTHPFFGKITREQNTTPKTPKGRISFGVDGERDSKEDDLTIKTKKSKCPRCNGDHLLARCDEFKKDAVKDRVKFVRKNGLCDNCLFRGHIAKNCPKASFCKVTGCSKKHSTYLHPQSVNLDDADEKQSENKKEEVQASGNTVDSQNGYVKTKDRCYGVTGAGASEIGMPIVPVKVKSRSSKRTVVTYGLLDSGSNTTFCIHDLMDQLGIEGEETILSLTTLQAQERSINSHVVSLDVYDLDEENLIELSTVFSTPSLPVNEASVPQQADINRWPYLSDVNINVVDASVGLLIGNDVPKALEPKKVKKSNGTGPYAVKTVFGWTINGPLGRNAGLYRAANSIRVDSTLNEQFKRFCNIEFNDSTFDNNVAMSVEDKRAVSILESSAKLRSGHYELSLPWKKFPPELPNNRPVAEHRLALLKKRFTKDPELFLKYSESMDNLLEKGYAIKVLEEPLKASDDKILWYLPHHPVFNSNKPGKLRVVFDCAATYHGVSLNDQLLQEPDLTNSIVGVLTRFRQESIALMADIEAMFHQVNVCYKDRDFLRFLWLPVNNLDTEPEEFQMTVHLFGAKSSPTCANFALQKTAIDNADEFDEDVAETIKRNFYVDDCLKSALNDDMAIKLAADLRDLLQRGGFRLTKWVANSPKVLASIPEIDRAGSVKDLCLEQLTLERALGVQWDVRLDQFGFKIKMKPKPATRRGVLSVVSSVYDPLGFVAPFVLVAKIIMQDLCRKNLSWDDVLQDDYLKRWEVWLEQLMKIEQLYIPRCFKPHQFGRTTSIQLHLFADASERGYGPVGYLRLVNEFGDIHVAFVIGKARVAPLKVITIPRLELSAAVVATRLDKMIRSEIDYSIDFTTFWTDSTTMLGYVANKDKRFKTFVANRLAVIHETTNPNQWRYVNTCLNPADDASRGLQADALFKNKRWLTGSDFLWKTEDQWPSQREISTVSLDDDPEVRRESQAFAADSDTEVITLEQVFERFSSWLRLKIFIAWTLRYRENLRDAVNRRKAGKEPQMNEIINPISVEEIKRAEREIVICVQGSSFREEVSGLRKSEGNNETRKTKPCPIKKSSSIQNLDPQFQDGILRVGGRLKNAPIEWESKHPFRKTLVNIELEL